MSESEFIATLRAYIARVGNEPWPGATPAQIHATEAALGFSLPPLLRRIFQEIGNGGFGPGYLWQGIQGGMPDDLGETAVASYVSRRQPDPEHPTWRWPEYLLPVLHWGCCITSCLDCSSPEVPVIRFDPEAINDNGRWEDCFCPESDALQEWLLAWTRGADLFRLSVGPPMDTHKRGPLMTGTQREQSV